MYISYQQNNWAEWLLIAESAYNNKHHLSTERLLSFVNLRRYPNIYREGKELIQKIQKIDKFVQK